MVHSLTYEILADFHYLVTVRTAVTMHAQASLWLGVESFECMTRNGIGGLYGDSFLAL